MIYKSYNHVNKLYMACLQTVMFHSCVSMALTHYTHAHSHTHTPSHSHTLTLTHPHRLTVLPGLQRLYQEMATFEASALSDLNISIQTLEKVRTDYRAALLWMKDMSGKLHNPDYRDQLVRFREVSA